MKQWQGRTVNPATPYRVFGPEDDARLRPLALERVAQVQGRGVCFVCDAAIESEDGRGTTTGIHPPILVATEVGLEFRPPACVQHTILEQWPAADFELIAWMVRNGWGKPTDPALLGDVQ